MASVKIGSKADVPLGGMIGIEVQGKKLVLFNVSGKFYAIDGFCSHAGGHLWGGGVSLTRRRLSAPLTAPSSMFAPVRSYTDHGYRSAKPMT